MGTRRRPWADPDYKIIKKVQVVPLLMGSLQGDAQEHERMREEIVGEVLCTLYLMAAKKIILPESEPIVSVEKAQRQAVNSTGNNEAAHCIPGQVLITGMEPSHLLLMGTPQAPISEDRILAAGRLNALFARTQDLHRNFNYVDSRLEERGLREALQAAAALAVKEGLSRPKSSRLDRDVVLQSFKVYKEFKRDPQEEDRTPFELAYAHIEENLSSKDDEERLVILGEEAKIAEEYKPQKLSEPAMAYTEKILEAV